MKLMAHPYPSEQLFFEEIQHRIFVIRCKRKMTQEDLSVIMNVEPRQVQRWERNKEIRIPSTVLFKLAKVFDCSIHDFFPDDSVPGGYKNFK